MPKEVVQCGNWRPFNIANRASLNRYNPFLAELDFMDSDGKIYLGVYKTTAGVWFSVGGPLPKKLMSKWRPTVLVNGK